MEAQQDQVRIRRIELAKYRKARQVALDLDSLAVMIGPNASGKSNILDAFRFLSSAAVRADFSDPVRERGGIHHLAWKGSPAQDVNLKVNFTTESGIEFEWRVRLEVREAGFQVSERVEKLTTGGGREVLLRNDYSSRESWWRSESSGKEEKLVMGPTGCALGVAGKNEGFPARAVYEHVRSWFLCDPNPGYLRSPSLPEDPVELDIFGRNLAARLRVIQESHPEGFKRIRRLLTDIAGVPITDMGVKELDDGRIAFVMNETGLIYRVNQPSISSGTLRILALVVALVGASPTRLIAIEEPENYVHPNALEGLIRLVVKAAEKAQILLTTHSPLVLNQLMERPEVVRVVGATPDQGTVISKGPSREAILKALQESGFSLGDFWLSRGFAHQG